MNAADATSPPPDLPAPSPLPVRRLLVERVLLTGLASGIATSALLAAVNQLVPYQRPSTLALELARWIVGAHLGAALVVALVVAALATWWPAVATGATRTVAALLLAAIRVGNRGALLGLPEVGGPGVFRWGIRVAVVLSCGAVTLALLLPLPRRNLLRVVAAVLAVSFYVAVRPSREVAATAAVTPGRATPGRATPAAPQPRLLVLGVDGADWTYVEPLVARGLLPNLARLRAGGAWGPLESRRPTLSPVIWTSVATGVGHRRHGIRGFTTRRLRGVLDPLPRLEPVRWLGFEPLFMWMERRQVVREAPISALSRRVPALWTLMSQAGQPVTVLNWWATWPAEPILGRIVSERVHNWRFEARGWGAETGGLTWPADLLPQIADQLVAPDDIGWDEARAFVDLDRAVTEALLRQPFRRHMVEGELKYFLSMYESNRRIARRLVELDRRHGGRAESFIVLERLVDLACHAALAASDLIAEHPDTSPEHLQRYGRVVTQAYVAVDEMLGDLLQEYEHDNVVVLSDHGFHLQTDRATGRKVYGHGGAPPGIFVARGPAFRPGQYEGLGILDVFPLLARVQGLPLADDLERPVPEQVLSDAARAVPVRRVKSYESRGVAAQGVADEGADQEAIERLRALGYVP